MKAVLKIVFLIHTLSFCIFQLPAQQPCDDLALPQEHVHLQLDRNLCLAGETLWFKAWCFSDLDQQLSKVLYVEVFDETKRVIVQEKFLLTDHTTDGSIHIPEDVSSRHYFLRAYTRYMRNFSANFYHYQQITVVNPSVEGGSISLNDTDPDQEGTPDQQYIDETPENLLGIELESKKYRARQPIDFRINSPKPIVAQLAAVVRLQGLGNSLPRNLILQNPWLLASCREDPFCRQSYGEERPSANSSNWQEQNKALSLNQLKWLPETRGLTISGMVQNEENEKVVGALSMVSVLQKTPLLYLGTTDEQGEFTICLHHLEAQKDLFVGTPFGKNEVLIRSSFDSNFPNTTTVPLKFDSTLHQLIESLHLNQQLDRVYPKHKTQAVSPTDQLTPASANIFVPDYRIDLNEFIETPTMAEVFNDLIPGVRLRKKKGDDHLSIFNSDQQKLYDSPLVLLDNVPIFNITELLKINPAKIEAMEVFNSDYILGDYTLGGILSIISKTDDFAAYNWKGQASFITFKGFAQSQPFEQVVDFDKSHFPDFRPVLYWQPNIRLNHQKVSSTLSFLAPDRPGIYEILIQGFTEEGENYWGFVTFEVIP